MMIVMMIMIIMMMIITTPPCTPTPINRYGCDWPYLIENKFESTKGDGRERRVKGVREKSVNTQWNPTKLIK